MAVAPIPQHRTEELGTKQNVLECVGDRQVVYDRPPWPGWPGTPAAACRFCGSQAQKPRPCGMRTPGREWKAEKLVSAHLLLHYAVYFLRTYSVSSFHSVSVPNVNTAFYIHLCTMYICATLTTHP